MLQYHRTTEEEKYVITSWQYPDKYAVYNYEPYAPQKEKNIGFADPHYAIHSFYEGDTFVGFTTMYEEEEKVYFGIGANPACCNKGYGTKMTKLTIQIAEVLYPNKPLYLIVRIWNERAIRCYEKAGFVKTRLVSQQTPTDFYLCYIMEYPDTRKED